MSFRVLKVINIFERNGANIKKVTNKMIAYIEKNTKILDLHVTSDNLVLVLGEKE